jgi:hypothetical protein
MEMRVVTRKGQTEPTPLIFSLVVQRHIIKESIDFRTIIRRQPGVQDGQPPRSILRLINTFNAIVRSYQHL